jgi:hypothetical protein
MRASTKYIVFVIVIAAAIFKFFGMQYYPDLLTAFGMVLMLTVFFFIFRSHLSHDHARNAHTTKCAATT